jgi:tRNA pseudouridine38-40 synthase
MPRFRLSVEYVGTRYSGWQIQKNARTVQGELDRAVRTFSGDRSFEIYGSGRTDAGVHALGQVAHLDLDTRLSDDELRYGLNDALPPDINVVGARRVTRRFHARHSALGRSYLYQVSRRRTAFGKPFVWWVKDTLDVDRMRDASSLFRGLKDFRSFAAADPDEVSTKVQVDKIEVKEEGGLILIRILGSHFIWKMVRRVVGVLVEVGRGSLTSGQVSAFLDEDSARPATFTAPPSGLFLERVFYEGDATDHPLRATFNLAPFGSDTPRAGGVAG